MMLMLIVLLTGVCLQPWYSALEAMRYLLPDDQAREKLAGQSWQVCAKETSTAMRMLHYMACFWAHILHFQFSHCLAPCC